MNDVFVVEILTHCVTGNMWNADAADSLQQFALTCGKLCGHVFAAVCVRPYSRGGALSIALVVE